MQDPKPIELDGRTGEGGGQLVRLAVALAAVSTQPIRITHVRGNRAGSRGGGLKAQHVASIAWLAQATDAEVTGLSVGSQTLEFKPRLKPSQLRDRKIAIAAESAAASTLLIFQAIFPFLLFAGNERDEPVEVEISGGTNVAWSLSWEYLDQVLLPTLREKFGIEVERKLVKRGWSAGAPEAGKVWFRVRPLGVGQTLRVKDGGVQEGYAAKDFEVKRVDVSILAPAEMHQGLQNVVVRDLGELLPDAEVYFKIVEDSVRESRIYVLLVARSETLRWGRDILTSAPKKKKAGEDLAGSVARKVCRELYEEVEARGAVDEYLQDQLVVFQALAEGRTSFPRSGERGLEEELADLSLGDRMRRDKAVEPFGEGSTHTTTARWVTAQLLARVDWYNKGRVCQGIGMRMDKAR